MKTCLLLDATDVAVVNEVLLVRAGFDVILAESARGAADACRNVCFDLLFVVSTLSCDELGAFLGMLATRPRLSVFVADDDVGAAARARAGGFDVVRSGASDMGELLGRVQLDLLKISLRS